MNLYDLVVSILGPAPNDFVESLYYVLCLFLVVYVFKLLNMFLRSLFGIKK